MKCKHPKRYVVDLGEMRRCYRCGTWLSLGPSNDRKTTKLYRREPSIDNKGALDWDITRPLAEQWPWGGDPNPCDPAYCAHMARGDAMLDETIDNPLGLDPESVRLAHEELAAHAALEAKHAREIRGIRDLPFVERVPQDGWQERALAKVDSFAPVDTASAEPWHTTDETQPSGSLKTKPWQR